MHRPACLAVMVGLLASGWLFSYEPSAVAGTPAFYCADNQEATPHLRLLADASFSTETCARTLLSVSRTKLRFYEHHRWTLFPRYEHWWDIKSVKRRSIAHKARAQVRHYTAAMVWAKNYLTNLKFSRWLVKGLTCIHSKEGAWNDNTGNGYYGGLQMNSGFMRGYGAAYLKRWGTADNWPIWAQIDASIRAYESGRGFGPWPNTAAACGLPLYPLSPEAT